VSRRICAARHPGQQGITCTREPGHKGGHLDDNAVIYWPAKTRAVIDIDQAERDRRTADRLTRLAEAIGAMR